MSSIENEKCYIYDSNSKESDSDDQGSDTELGLFLEKLNLGPKKKLLVMNLNGFLLHRVNRRDSKEIRKSRTPDQKTKNFLLYKRPFSEEFMKFCFERFEVGLWSSAMEHNIEAALTCVMGSLSSKLLFIWDQEECTDSGYRSLENKRKPLFFKELNEVFLRIKKGGPYSELNTLLIDDKPYKTFLNPPNTAIFPESYKPENQNDKALDPEGELCMYLRGLADTLDVQTYVKDHPFGELAITPSHPNWSFYLEVKSSLTEEKKLV